MSPVRRSFRLNERATLGGLVTAIVGIVVLFGQALSEVLADPGLSLVDGYSIGRLPWTSVGVILVVIGATIAVVFGTVTAWLGGGAIRRALSALALLVAALWWFFALLPPPQAAFCASCPPPGPEPLTIAYSLPGATAGLLLFPALVVGALALSRHQADRTR